MEWKSNLKKCPDCGENYSTRECDCGYKESFKPTKQSRYEALRCSWIGSKGQQCRLVGGISPHAGSNSRFYCDWHYQSQKASGGVIASENYEEFLKYFLWQRDLEKDPDSEISKMNFREYFDLCTGI